MKFQEKYEDYLVHNGFVTKDELAHFGVPGMKWGVRKDTYRSLNRRQRRTLKNYSALVQRSALGKKNSAGMRETQAYKRRLESALGTKINDESAKGSVKNSLLYGAGLWTTAKRSSRGKAQSSLSGKELSSYLNYEDKKKKK